MKRLIYILAITVTTILAASCSPEHSTPNTGCPGHGGYGQTLTIEQTQNNA